MPCESPWSSFDSYLLYVDCRGLQKSTTQNSCFPAPFPTARVPFWPPLSYRELGDLSLHQIRPLSSPTPSTPSPISPPPTPPPLPLPPAPRPPPPAPWLGSIRFRHHYTPTRQFPHFHPTHSLHPSHCPPLPPQPSRADRTIQGLWAVSSVPCRRRAVSRALPHSTPQSLLFS